MEMDPEYISLLHKELTHQLNPDEAAMLKTWLAEKREHRQCREEIRRSWELSGTEVAESGDAEIEAELERLKQRIHSDPETTKQIPHYRQALIYKLLGIVLLLAIAAGGLFIYQNASDPAVAVTEYMNAEGAEGVKLFILPDSSRVYARAGTTLSYQVAASTRALRFSGQAYFQVARDEQHPFLIEAGEMRVKVLGTSFVVKARADEPLEVSVTSGSVEVQYSGKHYLLEKDELFYLSPEAGPGVSRNGDENYLSWQHGKLVFRQSPLREVLPALERHYGAVIDVENPQLLNCRFTGSFQDPALEELMEIFSYSLGVSVEKQENGKLLIRGGSCQGQGVK